MSGIAGICHLDRAPLDLNLLRQMTDFLSFRGHDGRNTWSGGHVGFGHALEKTTEESEAEHQPFSLDGKTWIVADARIDARADLLRELGAQGQKASLKSTDAELILRAYSSWGKDCVQHLLGDFAFGIWDEEEQLLFCARDQMGVKPFYYAHLGSTVIFSNTLECVRLHPAVSNRLNDQAIADFLLFEVNKNQATTTFADIQRLAPAHCATWSASGMQLWRYWTMPIDEPVFFRRKDDYVDRFKELAREAVGDRLRTNRIGVFMSGGIDSSTMTATALALMKEKYSEFDLQAVTRLDAEQPSEKYYAGLVARRLGIPIHFFTWNDKSFDPDWENSSFHTPEPRHDTWELMAWQRDLLQFRSLSRVFFFGEGPDNALEFEWRPYLSYLFRKRRYGLITSAAISTLFSQRRPPFWGRISRAIRQTNQKDSFVASYPPWLNPGFESRLNLRERFAEANPAAPAVHPLHPKGYESFHTALWQSMFEMLDPGARITCFEVRQPLADLRLIRYMLSVPALPWCRSKYLLRRTMRSVLPKPVLRRSKSGGAVAPLVDRAGRLNVVPTRAAPGIDSYVDLTRVPDSKTTGISGTLGVDLRARCLNQWLRSIDKNLYYPR